MRQAASQRAGGIVADLKYWLIGWSVKDGVEVWDAKAAML